MSDILTIICRNDVCVNGKKSMLSKFSQYFDRLLNGSFIESQQNVVKLGIFEADLLKRILTFYKNFREKGNIDLKYEANFCKIVMINHEECWKIIEMCDMLTFDDALEECDKYMTQTILHLSCLSITCTLAETFNRFGITKHAVNIHMRRSNDNKHEYKCENCRIRPTCINNARECDMQAFVQLYKAENMVYIIGGNHWQPVLDCYKINEKYLTLGISKDKEVYSSCDKTGNVDQMMADYDTVKSFPCHHLEEYRVTSLMTCIYVTGGFHDKSMKAESNVWKYDVDSDKWTQVSPMRHKRFYHCAFGVDELVFVCGGYNDDVVLQSLEVYREDYNEWVDLKNMPTGVGNAAYASHDGHLYVVCGQFGVKEIETTNAVQQYSIPLDEWCILTTYASPVFYPYSEYQLGCVILKNKMYVIGGQTVRVDEYDFGTKEWTRLSDMKFRRMEAAVCVVDDKIIVAGGYDYHCGAHHDSLEIFDPTNNSWRISQVRLPQSVRSLGLCKIMTLARKNT